MENILTNLLKKLIFALIFILLCQPEIAIAREKLIAVTLEYPPFNYTDKLKKSVTGSSPTLLRIIFSDMGYELEVFSLPWKRSQEMIEKGSANIIFTYTRSEARQRAAYYSNPVAVIRTIFVKNKNSDVPTKWETLEDLREYNIGVNGGYNYPLIFQEALRNKTLPKARTVNAINPTANNLRKLLKGRIDYFICPIDCVATINELPTKDKKMIEKIDLPIGPIRTMHVGFSKKFPGWVAKEVRNKFNVIFDQYLKDGKVHPIYQKHNVVVDYEALGSKLDTDWDSSLD